MRSAPLLWIVGCLVAWTPTERTVHASEITVPGDVPTIQAAIDLALDGDIVLVSSGFYPESIDYLGKSIHLLAIDGAASTTIDAQGLGPVVRFTNGETPMSVLEGFTVTGGVGDPTGGLIAGGGIRVIDASPQILGCVIANNVAADGAGIYVAGVDASPLFFQCSIEFNASTFTGGGVCIEENASPELFECTLLENTALSGGGVWVHIATPTIRDSHFAGNSATLAAGALAAVSADVFVSACDFRDNSAQNGGAVVTDDAVLLCRRSTFYNNSAQAFGGAFRLQGTSDVTLEHCTLAYNSGIQGGGAADVASADAFLIHNSIVYGNLFGPIPFEPAVPAATTIEYSVVQGGFVGEGNFDQDPLLENLEAGQFELLLDSPCINAGDPTSIPD
ncbi:MAG: right-handed parallel beta-helix repeat-containing protein, partial [Planctomycetota bacterium]